MKLMLTKEEAGLLERLARDQGVSHAEALRRAIRIAVVASEKRSRGRSDGEGEQGD